MTRPGLETTIYRIRGEHANHYATDALFHICISVIMAVNAWCCGLLECANYGPAPPTSALRVSVRVTFPLASGIRSFLETQEGLYRSQTGFILGVFSRNLSHKWVCRKSTEV